MILVLKMYMEMMFLIDRSGNVIARFEPTTDMQVVEDAIRNLL